MVRELRKETKVTTNSMASSERGDGQTVANGGKVNRPRQYIAVAAAGHRKTLQCRPGHSYWVQIKLPTALLDREPKRDRQPGRQDSAGKPDDAARPIGSD